MTNFKLQILWNPSPKVIDFIINDTVSLCMVEKNVDSGVSKQNTLPITYLTSLN